MIVMFSDMVRHTLILVDFRSAPDIQVITAVLV